MIDIRFKVDGRSVTGTSLMSALEKAIFDEVKSQIAARVGSASCPLHGQQPKILAEGRDLTLLKFSVESCCEASAQEVRSRLGA